MNSKIKLRGLGNKSTSKSIFAYPTGISFVEGMMKQSSGDYTGPSYFRSGFPELKKLEENIAKLIGIPKEYLYLMSSGMSAVVAALECNSPTKGDIVIHGTVEYSKIENYIEEDLKNRGVKTFSVNPGNIKNIEKLLNNIVKKKSKVKAIIFEIIGNGPEMPVLNVEKFLGLKSLRKLNPLIILDNTLATNFVIDLSRYIFENPELRIVGIESATKFYLNNQDLGGIIFTQNKEIRDRLLQIRTRIGLTPSYSLVEKFSDSPKTKLKFKSEILRSMKNSFLMAEHCWQVSKKGKFSVCYPNLVDHPNSDYVSKNFPDGIAPVFFLKPSVKSNMSSEEMFYRLDKNGAFKDIEITESFGFLSTSTYHNTRYGGYIRIAGGIESPNELSPKINNLQRALNNL